MRFSRDRARYVRASFPKGHNPSLKRKVSRASRFARSKTAQTETVRLRGSAFVSAAELMGGCRTIIWHAFGANVLGIMLLFVDVNQIINRRGLQLHLYLANVVPSARVFVLFHVHQVPFVWGDLNVCLR